METIEQRYRRYLEHPEQMEAEAAADVAIDLDDALPDMLKQASLYVIWGQLAAIADSQAEAMKHNFQALEAECRDRAFERLTLAGEKSTDQRVKDAAARDPAITKHLQIRKSIDTHAARLNVIAKALLQKKDMLIQVGFRQRAEFGYYAKEPDTRTRADYAEQRRQEELEELKQNARDAMQNS